MPPHEGTIHCPVCVYRYHTNRTRATAARPRPVVRLPPPPMKDGTQNDLARSYCEPRTCPTPPFLSERYPTRQTRPDPTRLPYPPSVQTSSSRRNILSAGVLTFGDDFFFFLSFFLELRFFFLFFLPPPPPHVNVARTTKIERSGRLKWPWLTSLIPISPRTGTTP